MTSDRRLDALRALAWILGVFGALTGLVGPALAGVVDPTAFVGVVSGSGACVLGAVVLDRQPANRSAWGFLAGGLLLVTFAVTYSIAAGRVRAGDTDVGTLAAVATIANAVSAPTLPLFQFLFPDGRLPSPRWRPVFVVYLIGLAASAVVVTAAVWSHREPGLLPNMGPVEVVVPPDLGATLGIVNAASGFAVVAMVCGVAAIASRLRTATGILRSQILLGLWGIGLTAALIATTAVLFAAGMLWAESVTSIVAPVPLLGAVTVAMRRHRLFDVQRLINQTVTYATLVALLLALYVAITVGTGSLAARIGLGGWPVAAATLAVAAAFRPLLSAVRATVDRRFDRRTWRAVQTIDAFTLRLRAGRAQPSDLPDMLRKALGDPTATVAYLDDGATITADGHTVALPGRLQRTVQASGTPIAIVDLDARLADEPHTVDAALAAAALPLENAALHARAAVRLANVEASRSRIVTADDSERRRIERDLHDGPQQRLVALALRLRMAERDLAATDRRAATVLADAVGELRATVDELRELTRGILPPVLIDEGLAVALRTVTARLPLPVTLDIPTRRLPPTVESSMWFAAREAMTNAVKHAGANALRVEVRHTDNLVRLQVADDGSGGALLIPGGGLQGLADRVAALGGRFTVTSPPGGGTTIGVELPCGS